MLAAAELQPDLVILDLGLPDRDGVDFIGNLRAWATLPVLVLSAPSALMAVLVVAALVLFA